MRSRQDSNNQTKPTFVAMHSSCGLADHVWVAQIYNEFGKVAHQIHAWALSCDIDALPWNNLFLENWSCTGGYQLSVPLLWLKQATPYAKNHGQRIHVCRGAARLFPKWAMQVYKTGNVLLTWSSFAESWCWVKPPNRVIYNQSGQITLLKELRQAHFGHWWGEIH